MLPEKFSDNLHLILILQMEHAVVKCDVTAVEIIL